MIKLRSKSRPCGFGQSLGWPIVQSISHFFWSTKKKFVQSQIFFIHSLEFFVQSFLKMWFWSVSWLTNCLVNFSIFWVGQKLTLKVRIFAIFDNFYSTYRKTLTLFNGLVIGFGSRGRLGRMCNTVRWKLGHTTEYPCSTTIFLKTLDIPKLIMWHQKIMVSYITKALFSL